MLFKNKLNYYLDTINCNSKELSLESGISQPVISRYRNGERTPQINSKQLDKLAMAIFIIANKKGIVIDSKEEILNNLTSTIINKDNFDYSNFSNNLNKLITALSININNMSKYIAFDASHISRIRYGNTKPSDPISFATKVCSYVVSKYNDSDSIKTLFTLLDCHCKVNNNLFDLLFAWLTNNDDSKSYISDFLSNLDNFDLNDYIKAIKFDQLKVPSIPFYHAKIRNYYGLEEMKKGELDFFKATVLSKSMDDIYMCSDMPMEDMAKDVDFGKKWMFAIAMSLKKGLHLNIIHNLDRPFNEMMLGLESWIPIYMTGQISPYYLRDSKNNIYHHFNYVSGTVALTGECINGYHSKGKYYLTSNKKEVDYYKEKANLLFKKANSLMDIYNDNNSDTFKVFMLKDTKIDDDRTRTLSSLPLFTINDSLLTKILKRNNIDSEDINKIIEYKKQEKKEIDNILKNNKITDIICEYDRNNFDDDICLSLENIFYNKKIAYNYDEYLSHLASTKEYTKNSNYKVVINKDRIFKNINITVVENNYVVLSKNSNPVIHFVIRHPKLVDAIKKFKPLVKE